MKILYKVNPVISEAARRADAERTQSIIDETQRNWDAGESFLSTGCAMDDLYPRQRESDGAEEVNAAAHSLEISLAQLAVDGALRSIPKETAAIMCEVLENADPFASITLYGLKMTVRDFASRWSKMHPGNEFYMAPDFEN